MRSVFVVLLLGCLFAGAALAQGSENAIAAANQAKALFLKSAGLPESVYDIIGQPFTFFYDDVPAGWSSISGTVLGLDFKPSHEIALFVSVPTLNNRTLYYLHYGNLMLRGETRPGWHAAITSGLAPGPEYLPGHIEICPRQTSTRSQ